MNNKLADQIAAMQKENDKLKEFEKLLDKAMRIDLGIGRNEVQKMISDQNKKTSHNSSAPEGK